MASPSELLSVSLDLQLSVNIDLLGKEFNNSFISPLSKIEEGLPSMGNSDCINLNLCIRKIGSGVARNLLRSLVTGRPSCPLEALKSVLCFWEV